MSFIHTWRLNQPAQIPVSVSLERRNGEVVAFLQKEERRILITTIKGLPENLQGLDGTIARVKEVGGEWRLKVTPLQRAEAGGERNLEVTIKHTQKTIQHEMKARNKDVVAFIGNTGTGKSNRISQMLTNCEVVEGGARVFNYGGFLETRGGAIIVVPLSIAYTLNAQTVGLAVCVDDRKDAARGLER